jgi:hypothetical protein
VVRLLRAQGHAGAGHHGVLNKAVNDALPSLEQQMIREGADPVGGSAAQFGQFVQKEYEKWNGGRANPARRRSDRSRAAAHPAVAGGGRQARVRIGRCSHGRARTHAAHAFDDARPRRPTRPSSRARSPACRPSTSVLPGTQRFYDALRRARAALGAHPFGRRRPAHLPGAGARGVQVTTSSGANAPVVAQTALLGLLALARHWPLLLAAQREHRWAT